MTYIDTNVLVRVITGDNQALADQAIARLQSAAQNEFIILDAVLVELCFVLEFHRYKMARVDIAAAITALIAIPQIMVADTTLRALKLYKQQPQLDYTDCLLIALGGKQAVFSFDQALQTALL